MFDARCMVNAWLCGPPTLEVPRNVWIGTTVENQEMADKRIPELNSIPARVRFLSCEPLLGPVILPSLGFTGPATQPDWVICGGESGPAARPMREEWARYLRDQCAAADGLPFFMKQMGGVRKPFAAIPEDLMIRQFPNAGGAR